MLQLRGSSYERGRSNSLIKLKVSVLAGSFLQLLTIPLQASRADKEALVTAVLEDNFVVLRLYVRFVYSTLDC